MVSIRFQSRLCVAFSASDLLASFANNTAELNGAAITVTNMDALKTGCTRLKYCSAADVLARNMKDATKTYSGLTGDYNRTLKTAGGVLGTAEITAQSSS